MRDLTVASAERIDSAQSHSFNAPLFRSLIEKLESRERWVVLDFGAACTRTIALFGQYRCRLDIADLADGLDPLNALTDSEQLHDAAEALLPGANPEATDLVLCWDILNYLERPALAAIMARVEARSRRGTLVHALIHYSDPRMPARPGRFVPVEGLKLANIAPHRTDRAAPRYTPDDLRRCLPASAIDRAMLLSNGMQEFLFRL